MAIYVFVCKNCGHHFDESMTYEEYGTGLSVVCPECGSHNVKRVYSIPPIIYKTDGFYTTDNKKGN